MDADKFAELQYQMRQNQQELQDFLKGMDSWEEDMKKKDVQLKSDCNGNKDLPPVRNSASTKKKKKKIKKSKKIEETVTKKPKKISSYDYRAWDKFDVEKECAKVQDKSESSSSEYETDEEWEEQRRKVQANMEKENGNQYFKEGKYDEAVECYSRGYELDSMNALLPANRAMALLKQHKYAAAEQDCTIAITIDPTYVKAYSRRATARQELNKLQEAHADFTRVLKLDPTNKQAKKEIEKIDKVLNPVDEPLQTTQPGIIKAIYKPPAQRSKKPLRRIEIEEIGVEDTRIKTEIAKMESQQSVAKQRVTARDSQDFQQFISTTSTPPANHQNSTQNQESNDRCTESENSHTELNLNLSLPESENTGSSEKTKAELNAVQHDVSPNTSPRVPGVPQNSFQFQTDWKELKRHDEKFYAYIKQIKPALYPRLFGQAMDADILLRMLNTYKIFYIPKKTDIFEELKHLSAVKRFSMTVMFMSTKKKKVPTATLR